ncbi:MAG: sugar phosphate nucleotidyltransferase, partial [Candidatus Omnitrophota bacterium]
SRKGQPKQFLRMFSKRSMLEETIGRVRRLTDKENIYIATNKIYYANITKNLKRLSLPAKSIFFEPQSRNTLGPIGWLSQRIYEKDRRALIAVLPSDHYVRFETRFLNLLSRALEVAREGFIVTVGIRPQRPETGYGYIKIKSKIQNPKSKVYEVERFIEKPSLSKAKKLIKDKRCYWNAGIFIFRPEVLLDEIKRFAPREYRLLGRMRDELSIKQLWPKLKNISIDYAVMEKTSRLLLLPASVGWSDMGSWLSLELLLKKDSHGNILRGACLDVGSRNIMAWSDKRILATIGLQDVIVVSTKDACLVCAKDRAQDVKTVVQILKQKKLDRQI